MISKVTNFLVPAVLFFGLILIGESSSHANVVSQSNLKWNFDLSNWSASMQAVLTKTAPEITKDYFDSNSINNLLKVLTEKSDPKCSS